MNLEEYRLVRRTQPDGRWLFPYYKDRYAVDLLSRFVGEGRPKGEVQASRFARLLQKPLIRKAFARSGDGILRRSCLDALWPANPECYRVTLNWWGDNDSDWRWDQVSRRGYSLVLQINFSERHDAAYRRWIERDGLRPFDYEDHPVARGDFHSLAWVRLDLDLGDGEALIEEVQSDWIRYAARAYEAVRRRGRLHGRAHRWWRRYLGRHEIDFDKVRLYYEQVLTPHLAIWSELALAIAISYIRDDLGIKNIWQHGPESGAWYKNIGGGKPPRSIYTSLPRSFCFEKVQEPPAFLARARTDKRFARSPGRMSMRRRKRWIAQRQPPSLDFWRLDLP